MEPVELKDAQPFHDVDVGLTMYYDRQASQALGKDYWRVMHSFKYYVGDKANDTWVVVPAGYLTDGATVPRPFWSLIPPWGSYGQAAVVHDWLCEHTRLYQKGQLVTITRAAADAIFKEAMKAAGVGFWRCSVMYWAVRGFAKLRLKPKASDRALKQALESVKIDVCSHCRAA